jgi:hypothetical protein
MSAKPPDNPLDPLSPREERLRKVLRTLLSRPTLLIFGVAGVWNSIECLPNAVRNLQLHIAGFQLLSGIVGLLCLVPVVVTVLHVAVAAAESWLNRLSVRLKRVFPSQLL